MINKADLIKWLNGCVYKGKNSEGARIFALRHLDADDRASPIEEWPNKPGLDIAELAEDVILTATRDAIGLESIQKYVVECYFGTSKVRGKRFTATVDGGGIEREDGGGGWASEPAGPKGESMQLRRHAENMHRLSIGGANETLRILRSENEQLRAQVTKLMEKHFEVVDQYEKYADQSHKRQIENKKIEDEQSLKKQIIDQVTPLIPVLAMKALPALTGEAAAPAAAAVSTPEAMLFKALSKHIIDNQERVMPALFSAFGDNPALIAGIKELIDKYGVAEAPAAG